MPRDRDIVGDEREAWLARSRTAWDSRAPDWDAMLDAEPDRRQQELDRAITALALTPGMRLLDAGCGTGQWAVGFAQYGCRVTAVDLAPEMLRHARANAEEARVEIALREGDLASLEDPDNTYDAIHCRCALQFSPDPAAALRELHRVIKPDGRLFVAIPGALSPIYANSWQRFLEPGFTNRMLPWELEALLMELGWRVVDGWGVFVEAAGSSALVDEASARALPHPLQQAAATFWITIASPSSG